jgi:hypothetical protein
MIGAEDAGIGAAAASRANAASEVMRPGCDQESTSCAAACGPTAGWSSSCGAGLRVNASISRASLRSSAVSWMTRRAMEHSASKLPRSSGSRLPSGRVAASRCKSLARVSGRDSALSGSGVVISRSRNWQRPARCDGSRAHNADRLLIRPASGRRPAPASSPGQITGKTPADGIIRKSSHRQRAPAPP